MLFWMRRRGGRRDADVEAHRQRRRRRRRAERCRGRPGEVEEIRIGLDALGPHAVLQDDRAVQQERARRSLQAEIGVDDRAEAVGIADRHPFAGRREADRRQARSR